MRAEARAPAMACFATLAAALLALPVAAQPGLSADAIAKRVWEREASEGRVGTMHFQLVAASGAVRRRQALMLHSDRRDAVRLAIFFQQPASIANTAFLSHDHRAKPDETWLFLPATERVRRIPASQRADAFLGTDLSFGDLKDGFRFAPEDWTFAGGEQRSFRGRPHLWLTGRARTPEIARETGYSAFRALICPETLFP
ncbi:MAG: outer membrane lipoprotein-sorting protein, partial [Thermaurantiacus sp.]